MSQRQKDCSQELSAAKSGISTRSGRRIEKGQHCTLKKRHWKTRKDPFELVWSTELEPLLSQDGDITGMTLWEYLDDEY
ncbi:MAG: IS21 family transposase, partial [Piscirickettsiaceae bacterium]